MWVYQLLRAPARPSSGSRLPVRGGALKFTAQWREDSLRGTGEQQSTGTGKPLPHAEFDMPWDDESLVAGLKERNSLAVQYAVETYAPRLYRYAIYQLGEHTAAEDLAAETITRMLEKIDQYRHTGAPFQSWLFSIARNLVRDSYRRRKGAEIISLDASMESAELQDLGSTDATIERVPEKDALARIMANLTEEQRQILILRIVEGWQPQEIADLLGRSIDSVKSMQYRALQAMKKQLQSSE
jgi:RNA polymerase sigma-70 factor (ECF subfamily)